MGFFYQGKEIRVFGNVFRRIAALPLVAKVLLAVASLIALGILIALSPLMVIVAFLVLLVATFALFIRLLRRRPLRTWGFIALASLLLVIVFSGLTNALYGGGAPEQASSPQSTEEEAKPDTATAATEAEEETPIEEAEQTAGLEEIDPPEEAEDTTEAASSVEAAEEEAQDEDTQGEYDATTRVTRVVDGDTIEISPAVDGVEEVRLIGIDTPETKEPGCAVQPYGPEASEFTISELQGEEVELEFDEEREDRYDRLLAYVYKEGEMFNETLLDEGYAQVYTVSPNEKYEDRFEEAQSEAQAAERGIWALSSSEQAQLTDRGNGIGDDGCAQKEIIAPPETPPAQPEPTPYPDPMPEPDVPPATPTLPRQDAPSTPPPSGPPAGGGVNCSTGVRDVPVVPGSKGDGDGDGIACER